MKCYEVDNEAMIYYLPRELDHYAADRLKRKTEDIFAQQTIRYLIFDFEKTIFMDSSGIGLITGRFRRVNDQGGKVYVVHVGVGIDKILELSGIYRIVQKMDSKEDILKEMVEGGYYA